MRARGALRERCGGYRELGAKESGEMTIIPWLVALKGHMEQHSQVFREMNAHAPKVESRERRCVPSAGSRQVLPAGTPPDDTTSQHIAGMYSSYLYWTTICAPIYHIDPFIQAVNVRPGIRYDGCHIYRSGPSYDSKYNTRSIKEVL